MKCKAPFFFVPFFRIPSESRNHTEKTVSGYRQNIGMRECLQRLNNRLQNRDISRYERRKQSLTLGEKIKMSASSNAAEQKT